MAPGDSWFLDKVFKQVLRENRDAVYMGRVLQKQPLYQRFSWWYRFSKQDTRTVLKLLASAYDGVRFSNRGLWIPASYLDLVASGRKGGGPDGVGS